MSLLSEKSFITQMYCGSNFAYILNDNGIFLTTEYKVLHSQENSCFVKCMKMMHNGKIQLYYLTQDLKSFASIVSSLDTDSFLIIVANLFSNIIEVKHNGFLSCQNIDVSLEHIFVDPYTYKVSLVYLPTSQRIYEDNSSFENNIRTDLIKLISEIPTLSSPKTLQLSSDLSNGMLTFEDLYNRVKGIKNSKLVVEKKLVNNEMSGKTGAMRIVTMNAPTRIELTVTKDDFVIGKKAELCDGVISFNKMISRSHCRISKQGNKYTVTDLQSANGTYVNRVRLQPNQPHVIYNGDVIRLANSDFQVIID